MLTLPQMSAFPSQCKQLRRDLRRARRRFNNHISELFPATIRSIVTDYRIPSRALINAIEVSTTNRDAIELGDDEDGNLITLQFQHREHEIYLRNCLRGHPWVCVVKDLLNIYLGNPEIVIDEDGYNYGYVIDALQCIDRFRLWIDAILALKLETD
jgi:hypothetical protein